LQFSANYLPRERLFLHKEMQRLLQLAPRQAPASIVADHPQQPQQRQKKIDNILVWDPMSQLSTIEQVAALEEQLLHTASSFQDIDAPTPGLRRGWWQQQQQQQQDLHGSSSTDNRRGPIHPVIAQQQLFSVYVHSPDGMLLPSSSIFSGTELRVRLNTTQGYAQHVLAEAGVLLLRAALQDASNVHFVMVSDTSIPLYPPQVWGCSKHSKGLQESDMIRQTQQERSITPHVESAAADVLIVHMPQLPAPLTSAAAALLLQVVWAQMMSEQRSRLDACKKKRKDLYDYYRWALPSVAQSD
jgi:hypothetical protein